MAETQTLNFGPEWLRALSGGGSSSTVASPPLSPALPKYKLADYRYGREEMLALYVKDNKIPVDLHDKEFLPILQEDPLPPLALVPFTEEEQRNFSMSVNSAAVLRLTGRGAGVVAGTPRGRSSSRGGRGEGGFYQRSFDDVEGGFGRGGREMHRSQSWEERGDRRFEKPSRKDPVRANYEDSGPGGLVRKHDFTRAESENWRVSREEQNGEDEEGGGWRLAGSRRENERWCPPSPDGPRSAGWRDHPEQRRRFPFDSRGEEERGGGFRRPRSGSGSVEDERDSLPEWCLEDAEEETGTFDSSGAFLSLKKAPKEPILEEVELEFRPLEECEESLEKDGSESENTKEPDGKAPPTRPQDRLSHQCYGAKSEEPSPPAVQLPASIPAQEPAMALPHPSSQPERPEDPERVAVPEIRSTAAPLPTPLSSCVVETISVPHATTTLDLPAPSAVPLPSRTVAPTALPPAGHTSALSFSENVAVMPADTDEDEGLKHFEQEAEKMVAYLQDGAVDDDRLATKNAERPSATGLPLSVEGLKWYYKDPQGEIQGPFSSHEMSEWFQAGYFPMTLMVKRGCDEGFHPLGEIFKMWGRVPFAPGPTPPPVLGDADQERMKRQQELNALSMYQLQQLQYQYMLRFLFLVTNHFFFCALRSPEQQPSLLPPVTHSLSVPDSGSVWDMQNPSSQPACPSSIQPATSEKWEGASVWDLPIDTVGSIEQIQLEKAKAEKVRQDFLLRHTRQEEALRRQQEQEESQRRQKQEEERLAQEEALRRLEEKREEEEQRRKREELLRKQEEERRKQEELEAQRKREEERRLEEEAAALARQQQEEQKREQEQRREQELQRQRQQQQEALRRLQQLQQQQQLAQMKVGGGVGSSLSLLQRRLQQELQKHQHLQQPQAKASGWGSVAQQPAATKSLLEIQQEEAQQMKQRKEQQAVVTQLNRTQTRPALSTSVWGSVSNTSSQWSSDCSSVWGDAQNCNVGFWDEAVKETAHPPPSRKSSSQKNKGNANLSNSSSGRSSKKAEDEEKLLKLFQGASKTQDGFMQWCEQTLHTLNTANNLDVPTFASFLKEVDSPYEVHDYVRAYLGDTPQAKDFARQFLDRRTKQNANQQKPPPSQPQKHQQDSVWGVNQTVSQAVFQSNHSTKQQPPRFETVTSAGKKKKKQKMVRADPSLLGFSVNASSERLNMGEIETVEDF
uniref:GYF domain-containing protein n=1 Tax=Electrophorus electricus TaxID=8005 RepID=A0A4W4DUU6_ELEEL